MEKNFSQKNFNNFVWSPLGSRGNIYINFCLQVHFQVPAAWYCSHYLPPVSTTPVSTTPVANLPPASLIPAAICHRRATGVVDTGGKFAAGIVDTGGKFATGVKNTRKTGCKICRRCPWYRRQFATGVIDTGGKFATGVVDTGGAPWLANISANFRKNSKWS
jgi:hypothetical protein